MSVVSCGLRRASAQLGSGEKTNALHDVKEAEPTARGETIVRNSSSAVAFLSSLLLALAFLSELLFAVAFLSSLFLAVAFLSSLLLRRGVPLLAPPRRGVPL
ncbi:hypothetical protein EYF80_053302 [Liparis tanakae]|uniref:Uncharacterized protein n=1 Tax=Liparis tanakae TaxID=230148 RepID=A0A4Z2F622_9TELE|nr:hypothetical protein EYF80_053302 [Liparis tanakae]